MACTEADFAYLRSVVLEQSSNVLEPSRDYLFASRLKPLLKSAGFESLDCLIATLRRQPNLALKRFIAEAMTINETSFFRDRAPFDLMRLELLPGLIQRRASSRALRFWSAACSTGQEAHSLAMVLREHFPHTHDWSVEILGTDISSDVIARAQAGRYQRMEVTRGLPAPYLMKYLQLYGKEWRVAPEIQRLCRFQQRNLCSGPMLMENFDGILLRNVMLYFSPETRRRLLLNIHRILAPDGFLVLGSSEQPGMPTLFEPVLTLNTCYYRPIKDSGSPGSAGAS